MFSGKRSWATLIAACLVVGAIGCNGGDSAEDPNGETPDIEKPVAGGGNDVPGPAEIVEETPAEEKIPEVRFTDTENKTHKVKVGDVMPDAELPDAAGNLHKLSDLYGEELTIIFFWKSRNLYSVDVFDNMEGDVETPYAPRVRVIGINEGDTPEQVVAQIQKVDAKFANLLDPGGEYFDKIATEKLPRIYAVDPSGKILFFDTEYAIGTRRLLKQTIRVVLGESAPAADEAPSQ